mmetsp:Transcript_13739/g.37157  ORF Transcript_13739/g.37157 Transcript_13739/m.37157 type:complete len:617 (-) Transcript_13739:19-1869(-)
MGPWLWDSAAETAATTGAVAATEAWAAPPPHRGGAGNGRNAAVPTGVGAACFGSAKEAALRHASPPVGECNRCNVEALDGVEAAGNGEAAPLPHDGTRGNRGATSAGTAVAIVAVAGGIWTTTLGVDGTAVAGTQGAATSERNLLVPASAKKAKSTCRFRAARNESTNEPRMLSSGAWLHLSTSSVFNSSAHCASSSASACKLLAAAMAHVRHAHSLREAPRLRNATPKRWPPTRKRCATAPLAPWSGVCGPDEVPRAAVAARTLSASNSRRLDPSTCRASWDMAKRAWSRSTSRTNAERIAAPRSRRLRNARCRSRFQTARAEPLKATQSAKAPRSRRDSGLSSAKARRRAEAVRCAAWMALNRAWSDNPSNTSRTVSRSFLSSKPCNTAPNARCCVSLSLRRASNACRSSMSANWLSKASRSRLASAKEMHGTSRCPASETRRARRFTSSTHLRTSSLRAEAAAGTVFATSGTLRTSSSSSKRATRKPRPSPSTVAALTAEKRTHLFTARLVCEAKNTRKLWEATHHSFRQVDSAWAPESTCTRGILLCSSPAKSSAGRGGGGGPHASSENPAPVPSGRSPAHNSTPLAADGEDSMRIHARIPDRHHVCHRRHN